MSTQYLTVSIYEKRYIDSGIVIEFEELLKDAVENEKNVALNLSDLTFISSAGLRVIMGLGKVLNAKEGKVYLCNVPPHIKKIFEIAGFTAIFTFLNDVSEI
ncbi:MAG: STAS domain-containing protein [Deltaproteobacteria bacterium]|nr:STAS domain-containing protein [Deltaproteobacteria bacterium]